MSISKCKSNIFSESAVATYVALAYWSLNKVILKAPITILYFLKDEQPLGFFCAYRAGIDSAWTTELYVIAGCFQNHTYYLYLSV